MSDDEWLPPLPLGRKYTFRQEDMCFTPIAAFTTAVVGNSGFARWMALRNRITSLSGDEIERAIKTGLKISLPLQMRPLVFQGNVIARLLHGARRIGESPASLLVEPISYSEVLVKTVPVEDAQLMPSLPVDCLIPSAQVCLGAAFEEVRGRINSGFGSKPIAWPSLLQYFRLVRNACFHENRFRITRPSIDTANPPTWRTSVMPSDSEMNGRHLFREFLDLGDVPILVGDVAAMLRS